MTLESPTFSPSLRLSFDYQTPGLEQSQAPARKTPLAAVDYQAYGSTSEQKGASPDSTQSNRGFTYQRASSVALNVLLTGALPHAELSPTRKIYVLVTLGLVTALAMMDRNILNILLIPIQNEIGASDTAMGLLTGTAFAAVYATAAIPLSRIADKGNRRSLLAAALAVWSGATALCGLASSYLHLLLARVGVAGGEAAANPAIMSMISDLYPPNRRATAIGATLIGTGIGVFMGAAFGGYISDTIGWRTAFVVVGLPGVLIALLIWLTVPEPVRGASEGGLAPDPDSDTLGSTLRYLARIPTIRHIVLAKSFVQIASQAALIWFPAYLIRVHDMSVAETGLWYGMAIAASTIVAAVLGGTATRVARPSRPRFVACLPSMHRP